MRKNTDDDKFEDKLEQLKNKEVNALLFDEYLRETNNEKSGLQSLTKYLLKNCHFRSYLTNYILTNKKPLGFLFLFFL